MKNYYLVVDGYLNGTGIRDYYEGGYLSLSQLGLSVDIISMIQLWLDKYWKAFYEGYENTALMQALDEEGLIIAKRVEQELGGKISYYSDAKQQTLS